MAKIQNGTNKKDTLIGEAGFDNNMIGNAGNDLLIGADLSADHRTGHDLLDGGIGNDMLRGDALVYGVGSGDDTLYGGDGNDTLWGDANQYGGTGKDVLDGGRGADSLNGGGGDDSLDGGDGSGNDTLGGDGGNDTLDGGDGTDRLNGGDGNDVLIASSGRDNLVGGTGVDLFIFDQDNMKAGSYTLMGDFRQNGMGGAQEVIDLSGMGLSGADAFHYKQILLPGHYDATIVKFKAADGDSHAIQINESMEFVKAHVDEMFDF